MEPNNDPWERKKRYLFGKFLVNPGFAFLSPIEERSSSPGSDDSLPELVVEPEPDRHDDPPEYYEGLTRRMRAYHRQLFLGETASDDKDSSEFEINQSMTSTFILDNNAGEDEAVKYVATHKIDKDAGMRELIHGVTEEESVDIVSEEKINDSDKDDHLSEASDAINGEISPYPDEDENYSEAKDLSTEERSTDSHKPESETEVNEVAQAEKRADFKDLENVDLSQTKSTSDSDEGPCHIISSTVVDIHERRPKRATILFEDASPVLVPKFVCVSRSIAEPDDVGRDDSVALIRELDVTDQISETAPNNANEINKDEANIEKPDTDVQRLLSVSEVTNISHDSKPLNTEYVLNDVETGHLNKNQEEDVENNGHIIQEKTHPRYSKVTDDEKSIGPNEFHYSTLDSKITEETDDNESNSLENTYRRALFETKIVRITQVQSSDEEMDLTDKDFEPVEEIRAPREFGIRESLHRASVDTQDSPALAFERRASADRLEDVSSDSHEINASLEKDIERKSSKDPYHTPPLPQTNVISALDDFWSVSPMDIEYLLETSKDKKRKTDSDAENEPIIRRKRKDTAGPKETIKRKERKDIATQTSSNRQGWEDLRSNFFVGKPLVLRLCSCPDHVCSTQINKTG